MRFLDIKFYRRKMRQKEQGEEVAKEGNKRVLQRNIQGEYSRF